MEGSYRVEQGAPAERHSEERVDNCCRKSFMWAKVSSFVLMFLFGAGAIVAHFTLGGNAVIAFSTLSGVCLVGFVLSCLSSLSNEEEIADRKYVKEIDDIEERINREFL